MNRRNILIAAMATLLLIMAGCRSHRNLADGGNSSVPDGKPTAANTLPQLDTILNAVYSSYCANFSCGFEGVTLNGQIRIIHDSCIWISVNKIIEVGRILITPTRVSGYSRIMNKYYDGTYDDLRKRWGIDLDYATIEALLAGNCPPHCTRVKEPAHNGNVVTLWYKQKGRTERTVTLTKDYVSKLLVVTELSHASPQAMIRFTYTNRTAYNGQMMPTTIDAGITVNNKTRQTQLSLSRITLNQRQNTPFSIPSKLEKL